MAPAASHSPFSCTFSGEVPDILTSLGCSLMISTYQAGKVIFLSPGDDRMNQLARNFSGPMGIAVQGDQLALATQNQLLVFSDTPALAASYPGKAGRYDRFFVPRAAYFTANLDIHEIRWIGGEVIGVVTLFSCIARFSSKESFTPLWQPDFITALMPEDRCHLNGLAVEGGKLKYATALGRQDTKEGWRATKNNGGVLMDVEENKILCSGLAMPHSPRLINGDLFVLESVTGNVLKVDRNSGERTVVNRVNGFARGMARYGDYLFVGHSRIRKNRTFGDIPVAAENPAAGISLVHLPSGRIAGSIQYLNSCEEIFDVKVIPDSSRPNILGVEDNRYQHAISFGQRGIWAVPNKD